MTTTTHWHDGNLDPSDYVPFDGTGVTINGGYSAYSSLSSELLTNGTFTGSATGWGLGAGWTYSSDAVHKSSDGTGDLAQYEFIQQNSHRIEIVVSNLTVGSFDVLLGENNLGTISTNGTHILFGSCYIGYGSIYIRPTNTSRFTIESVSLKYLIGGTIQVGGDISTNTGVNTPSLRLQVDSNIGYAKQYGIVPIRDESNLFGQDWIRLVNLDLASNDVGFEAKSIGVYDNIYGYIYITADTGSIQFRDSLFEKVSAQVKFLATDYITFDSAPLTTASRALYPVSGQLFYQDSYSNGYSLIATSGKDFNSGNLSIGTATFGAEKLTNGTFTGSATGWTLGTGWAYSSNTARKGSDGTGTLSQAVGSMVTQFVVGEVYTLLFTLSSFTAGSFTISAGGVTLKTMTFNGNESNGNKSFTFTALSNTALTFTPTNTSRFTIDSVSLKKHTAGDLGVAGTAYLGNASVFGRVTEAGTFAGIHFHDASTAQAIATGTTYTKLTAFTDNDPASNATSDATNDKVTITKAGKYLLSWHMSFDADTNNLLWFIAPFLGGVEVNNAHQSSFLAIGLDQRCVAGSGIITATANQDLDLRARHDNAGSVNITPRYGSLTVTYIGE